MRRSRLHPVVARDGCPVWCLRRRWRRWRRHGRRRHGARSALPRVARRAAVDERHARRGSHQSTLNVGVPVPVALRHPVAATPADTFNVGDMANWTSSVSLREDSDGTGNRCSACRDACPLRVAGPTVCVPHVRVSLERCDPLARNRTAAWDPLGRCGLNDVSPPLVRVIRTLPPAERVATCPFAGGVDLTASVGGYPKSSRARGAQPEAARCYQGAAAAGAPNND